MEERKTLSYDWENGHEEVVLQVASYTYGNRPYIGMYCFDEEGDVDPFDDLTINLPDSPAEVNQGYIDDLDSKSKLAFIKKYKLGKTLPEMGHSGYQQYAKVSFDLERLSEFDPKGVEGYKKLHGLEGQGHNRTANKGRKKQEMER